MYAERREKSSRRRDESPFATVEILLECKDRAVGGVSYVIFLVFLAKLVQAEAAVECGYWQQKRLMNPLRSRLQNDSIRDEMRILLNGVAVPSIAFTGMQCWTYSEGWNT